MSNLPFDEGPVPPRDDHISLLVHRLKPGEERFYRLLGPWRVAWLHWGPRNSVGCRKPEHCPLCPDPKPLRWEGYSPGLVWRPAVRSQTVKSDRGTWQKVIVPIMRPLRDYLLQKQAVITGLIFRMKRLDGRNALHQWEVMEPGDPLYAATMPAAWDVRPALERMWRFTLANMQPGRLGADELPMEQRPPQADQGEAQPG